APDEQCLDAVGQQGVGSLLRMLKADAVTADLPCAEGMDAVAFRTNVQPGARLVMHGRDDADITHALQQSGCDSAPAPSTGSSDRSRGTTDRTRGGSRAH